MTQRGVVKNDVLNIFLISLGDTVNAFKGNVRGGSVELTIHNGLLSDAYSGTLWDARRKYKRGSIKSDLEKLAISDEYWFFGRPSSRQRVNSSFVTFGARDSVDLIRRSLPCGLIASPLSLATFR